MILNLPELVDLNTYINAERTNRYIAAAIKKNMTHMVAAEAKAQLKPIPQISKITFIWRHRDKRKDFDNVEGSQKFIRDGLVQAKIISNDGWQHFPPRTLHKHEINKHNPGVTVLIK